jgi:hypothetical protein
MIRTNDHKQMHLFDPWDFLSPKRRKMLDESWAGLFQQEILRSLPVNLVKPFFSKTMGRPTKELYTMLGAMLLQQTHNLTDEEAVAQLSFNIQWHYALNLTDESDASKYLSLKTLWNFRQIMTENELDVALFNAITDKLAKVFQVNTDNQRLDSVHIKSNMRRLGRISIFSTSINKFLVNLKRKHPKHFATVNADVIGKYISEKALSCFSLVKPSESSKTLTEVSKNLYDLIEQFKDCPNIKSMYSYKLLERVLNEQCNLKEDPLGGQKVELKIPKEIPSDSLQNPSDPDATYSGHKGQGYQAQVTETFTKTEDEEEKAKTLNLITNIEVEPASDSDADAFIPNMNSIIDRGLGPKEIQADSLYGSDKNHQAFIADGIDLVAPTMGTTAKGKFSLSDFSLSDDGQIMECPQGQAPELKKRKKGRLIQGFHLDICMNCPHLEICPVKPGKKYAYYRYSAKSARIANRRQYEQTDEFKSRYRWRAGVEATMSELDRRTSFKNLRYRGMKAIRFAATMKAVGINIVRATAARKAISYA